MATGLACLFADAEFASKPEAIEHMREVHNLDLPAVLTSWGLEPSAGADQGC
jgi:hypothetical protein